MSSGFSIPIDGDDTRIRGKLARIKRDAAQAGQSFSRAARAGGAMGGPVGGVFTRGLGGFAGGMGWGMAGAASLAAGAGVRAFMAWDDRNVNRARASFARDQEQATVAKTVIERIQRRDAGGASFNALARRSIVQSGRAVDPGSMRVQGRQYGLTGSQVLSAHNAAWTTKVPVDDILYGMASSIIGDSGDAVAENIMNFGGDVNAAIGASAGHGALSASQNMKVLLSDEYGSTGWNILTSGSAKGEVDEAAYAAFLAGRTAAAGRAMADDEMNPAAKLNAANDARWEAARGSLLAAAAAQSTFAAFLKDVMAIMGGEGSERSKLNAHSQTRPADKE